MKTELRAVEMSPGDVMSWHGSLDPPSQCAKVRQQARHREREARTLAAVDIMPEKKSHRTKWHGARTGPV